MKVNSLAEAVLESALRHPEKTAIKIKDETLTYRELLYKSSQIANTLNGLGANKLAVGVVGQRHMSSYVGVLGALLAGCYYVPINPKLIKDKITSIFIDSKIKFLIGDIDNFETIKSTLDDYSAAIKVTPFQYVPDDNNWIDKGVVDSKSDQIDTMTIELDDLAYVMYTSGSTGNPKGVIVSHRNVLAYLEAINNLWNLPENFNMSQFHDLSFDPSVSDMFFTLTNGGTLCVVPEDEMLMPSDFIINEKIDIWSSVPSIGSFMINMGALEKGIFPNLKIVRFAGEPLSKKMAEAWQNAAPNSSVENHYGPTEATIDVLSFCYTKCNSKETLPQGIPIGKPMKNMTVEIVDFNSEKVVSGIIGELVYKGPQITKGYLNDKKKTNSVFVQFDWDKSGEIWYKSGDLGFLNKNGDFECIGRKDNQIKLGGRRIEIGEIEAALSKFKPLQDVVVVPIKNDDQITIGCFAFTMNEISKDDQKLIRHQSAKHLEQVFFPKRIVKLDQFPRSPSGKIDRKALSLKAKSL
jgi:amino acid adenylation domain-containing protein